MLGEVLLVPKHDAEHALFVSDLLRPAVELVEGALVIDGIAEDGHCSALNKQMR